MCVIVCWALADFLVVCGCCVGVALMVPGRPLGSGVESLCGRSVGALDEHGLVACRGGTVSCSSRRFAHAVSAEVRYDARAIWRPSTVS